MRQIRLQMPNLAGPDVADWQAFLKGQSVYKNTIDGEFGPKSEQATRGYQTVARLISNGIVAKETMTQALADGYQTTLGANLWGMDASVGCGGHADDLASGDMRFVARYYSDSAAKALTLSEAQKLSAAGLDIVAVFEDFNNSVDRFSAAAGKAHAAKALQSAAAIGQPAGSAIYFAVDYDAAPADVRGAISDYFKAVQNAFSAAPKQYAVGVYGSGLTCRVIRDANLAKFTWLCGSLGLAEYAPFRKQADLVQLVPERIVAGGLNIDDDVAQSAEFGAFRVHPAQQAAHIET